jgi:hypothetical protein
VKRSTIWGAPNRFRSAAKFWQAGEERFPYALPSFAACKARMLFEGPYLPTAATIQNYDVSPDGQRFLMLKAGELRDSAPTQIKSARI